MHYTLICIYKHDRNKKRCSIGNTITIELSTPLGSKLEKFAVFCSTI